MAFFQLVLKADRIRRARRRYQEEKLHSIEISKGNKPRYTIWQKIRHQKVLFKRKARQLLRKLICCPESSWIYQKIILLLTEGTAENYVLKSVFGFLGGILLTYMFFVFFVFQLHFSLVSATFVCSVLGVLLTIGLAFFPYVRCIVMLFLPLFFSKRGRQALMAYAFILTISGPAKNTLHNLGALSESLACIQQQLKDAVKSVIELVKHPFQALRHSIGQIVKSIKVVARKIKRMLIAIKRVVLSILEVIESAFRWLASIIGICNKKFGTPYSRCQGMFKKSVESCRNRLGDILGKICVVTNIARTVCMPLKPLDVMCGLVSYMSDVIVDEVKQKLRIFAREMRAMFFVRVKFSHHYDLKTNKSRRLGEISAEISSEIKARTRRFLGIFNWVGFLASLFFLFLFLRVVLYRYKWLTNDRFDNHYLTGYMRDIDLRRVRQDKETVFPLNWQERGKYISPTSLLLAKSEKTKLAKSVVFLAAACTKISVYLAIDYCLFWILDTIRYHGQIHRPREQQRQVYAASVKVKGNGFLAELYRGIAGSFSPYSQSSGQIDESICLPEPRPPNYDGYFQIVILSLLCWIMALFEPYGLRLRHVVLSQYYPDRAKERAIWLYNNILRSRGSFLKYTRRQLRRKLGTAHNDGIERVSIRERLWAVFPVLNKLAPLKSRRSCVLCGQPERDKSAPHVGCPTPGCVGVYCPQCFQSLKKLCTICLSPMDYGDLTDVSEERDSSEEEIDLSSLKEKIEVLKAEVKGDDVVEEDSGVLKQEQIEKIEEEEEYREKDVKMVTDTLDDKISEYSYGYQDETADESVLPPQRSEFHDIEAQPIVDDVTMQIFSECLSEDVSSSDKFRVSCFGFRRKKKRKKHSIVKEDEKSDSTSIADTESWTTEEIDDLDEEIEDFDDQKHSDDELLPDKCTCKKKTKERKSRFKRLFFSIGKMLFSFKQSKEKRKKALRNVNNKNFINDCYETDNSSSSIASVCDENLKLMAFQNSDNEDATILRKRSNKTTRDSEGERESCVSSNDCSRKIEKSKPELCHHPYEMKFKTRELPRHLKSICDSIKYYEADESSSCYSSTRETTIRCRTNCSSYTETRSSVDSDPSRERPSSTSDADNDSYIYTSDNNEKRYETHSSSSESMLPETLHYLDTLSDFSDHKKTMDHDNDKASNYRTNKTSYECVEEKIDDDANEKDYERNKEIDCRRKKWRESVDLYDTEDSWNFRKNMRTIKFDENNRDEYVDTLMTNKLDKVEKETVNAKKKISSLPKTNYRKNSVAVKKR